MLYMLYVDEAIELLWQQQVLTIAVKCGHDRHHITSYLTWGSCYTVHVE